MDIFWSSYKSLESEVEKVFRYIHIEDSQLDVYSMKLCELMLRIAVEIESISKNVYLGIEEIKEKETDNRNYEDLIKEINKKYKIDKKVVLLTSPDCFLSNREFSPFEKNTERTGKKRMTYCWNNAYQNVKHDRVKHQSSGTIGNVLFGLSALFLLNIYNNDLTIDLDRDSQGQTFNTSMGSRIFAISFHPWRGTDSKGNNLKDDDFNMHTYFIKSTEASHMEVLNHHSKVNKIINEMAFKNPKVIEYLKSHDVEKLKDRWLWDALDKETIITYIKSAHSKHPIDSGLFKYEAVLNKNQA